MRRLLLLAAGLYPAILGAQTSRASLYPDTAVAIPRFDLIHLPSRQPHVLRWWEAASVAGFTLLVMSQDEGTNEELREHPTQAAANLASAFRRVGQPEIYAALPAAIMTTGLLTGRNDILRAGGRLAASVVVATAGFETMKLVSGRARPDADRGAWAFSPFSGNGSFPSGHSTVAFALATSLSHELHNPIATVALYATATGTAWSRIYNARHWGSDVVLGAALGIASAELVHGRWSIFGLRTPEFLLSPDGRGVGVTLPLSTGITGRRTPARPGRLPSTPSRSLRPPRPHSH